jgi:hypothetical protein
MRRTGRDVRIVIEHPRSPEPSYASLWLTLDGKREDTVIVHMEEARLLDIAEEALKAAGILRRNRMEEARRRAQRTGAPMYVMPPATPE